MIEQLTLTNFRTFRRGKVVFGPVSLVLGANGVGKSNLFDALRFLKYVGDGVPVRDALEGHASTGPSVAQVAGLRGGGAGVPHSSSDSQEFELEVVMSVGRNQMTYAVRVDVYSYRIVHEELRASRHPGPYVFSTRPHVGPGLDQNPEAPVVVARYYKNTRGPNPRREFSPNEFILSQFSGRRAESKLNEDVAALARAELASLRPLELRPEVLRQYSPLGRFELGEHGENFAAVMWRLLSAARSEARKREGSPGGEPILFDEGQGDRLSAIERVDAIRAWLAELAPTPVLELEVQRSPTNDFIFAVRLPNSEAPVNARLLSDGTLRFAALALAVLGAPGRQTLVVEEIENGINPARLSLLVRMLEQVTALSADVQVVASTHAPGVLDFVSESTLRNSTVIGWDVDEASSFPVSMRAVHELVPPGNVTLGELQSEGWIQAAADRLAEKSQ